MWVGRRAQQAWHAAVLLLVLCATWLSSPGFRSGESAPGELPRPAVVAAVAHSVTPVVPEARLGGKLSPGPLFLFVAALVAFLFGVRRRPTWPAAAGTTSAAKPSTLLHAMRGRAPPRHWA